MVSKKKSRSKQKKSDGESSKRHPARQLEPEGERGAEVEEEHGRVDSTSPSVKITKSGSEKEEEEEEEAKELPVENKKSGQNVVEASPGSGKPPSGKVQAVKSGKGKRLKSEIDELKVESPSLTAAGSAAERQLRPRKQPAIFQEVSRGEGIDTLLSRIIGKKIQVYWPLDNKWYSGQVRSFDEKTNRHHVIYDDGEQERLELKKERIKIQVEPGQVVGETAEVSAAQPEVDKDIDMKETKEGSNKNSVKSKEEGDIVDGGKKNGVKKKQGKKNGRKRKDEDEETVGKKKDEMEVETMSTDVDDSKKKNEEDEENVNKSKLEKEDEGQGQVAEEVHNQKRPKTSKQTAPRTKRGGSGKKIVQEHVVEDQTEGVDGKQESKEQSHNTVQDIKPDEDVRATEHTTLEEVSAVEVDSAANIEGEKQQKAKESGKLPRKKGDGSVPGSSDKSVDTDDEMDAKRLSKDAGKQPKQTEKSIEKNVSTVVTEQHIDDQKPVEMQVLEQPDEDELTVDSGDRPKTANQMEEKRIDARGGDVKVTEKQIGTKDTDQVSKKHTNKKHHGRMKAREPVKK